MFDRFISAILYTEHRTIFIRLLFGLIAVEIVLYWMSASFSSSPSVIERFTIFNDERQRRQIWNNQLHRWNSKLVHKWRQQLKVQTPKNDQRDLPLCPATPPNLLGPVEIRLPRKPVAYYNAALTPDTYSTDLIALDDTSAFSWPHLLERFRDDLFDGGHYRPPNCRARQKVAIIIPYQNRDKHLRIFINHMMPILKRQQLDFRIYVVEQVGRHEKFNRGTLFNVGFVEAVREYDWQCVIFHDVDLLPENDRNLYKCSDARQPIHLSGAMDKFNYILPYPDYFGGVEVFPVDTFRTINGFSNLYWGWGGEDDDLIARVKLNGFHVVQPDQRVARYKMIKHEQNNDVAADRFDLLNRTQFAMNYDGLSTLSYQLRQMTKTPLFMHLMVEIHQSDYKEQQNSSAWDNSSQWSD